MPSTLPLFTAALLAAAPALATEILPVRNFHAVELRGGGHVDLVPGPAQRVIILEGTSSVTHVAVDRNGTLIVRTCEEQCPLAYRLRLEVQSPHAPDLAVDGGGMIVARSGFALQARFNAAINGGGRIDAREVDAARVSAAVNGGGALLVHPRRLLSAAVNGGGQVRYWGDPATSVAIRGGGRVTRGD